MTDVPAYVAREAAISCFINAAFSAAFFLAVFGFGANIPVWGLGNFVFDFLPQTFAVAFFASFVPSLLTRKAISSGKVAAATVAPPTVLALFAAAVLRAIAALLVGGAIWAALFWLVGTQEIAAVPAFGLKVLYGALLGAAVTRSRLRVMLG